jgi:hypothetical protein
VVVVARVEAVVDDERLGVRRGCGERAGGLLLVVDEASRSGVIFGACEMLELR